MSKELKALERIKKCLFWSDKGLNNIAIIKAALKEHDQYKAIEKEYGIDLVTLNKIRKVRKGYAFIGDYVMQYEITEINLVKGTVKGICDGCWHIEKIKDYGKTWALTREELLCLNSAV